MFSQIKLILISMRPAQWTKNLFVFPAIIFSKNLFHFELLGRVFLGFILFSLCAGGIYILNDIRDREKDRLHPEKSLRPIAAGLLKVQTGWAAFILLAAISLPAALMLDPMFFGVLSAYFILNVAYSLKLKHLVIIDVMCIAFGFALRVFAGTALAGVSSTNWLIICTITLSLFLGFCKRRSEIALIGENPEKHRKVLEDYSVSFLDQMIAIACACTVMSYAMYTLADETVARFGTKNLILTLPFVLYGIYRFLFLIHQKKMGENPTRTVLGDPPLIINGFLWLAAVLFVIY